MIITWYRIELSPLEECKLMKLPTLLNKAFESFVPDIFRDNNNFCNEAVAKFIVEMKVAALRLYLSNKLVPIVP